MGWGSNLIKACVVKPYHYTEGVATTVSTGMLIFKNLSETSPFKWRGKSEDCSNLKLEFWIFFFFSAAAKSLQSYPTLCDPHKWQPTRLRCPWDSPGKNTGVGCHFLLQCMKGKSESEVAVISDSSRPDPMDCSLPGSSVHGIFQARVLEWGAIAFSFFSHEKL